MRNEAGLCPERCGLECRRQRSATSRRSRQSSCSGFAAVRSLPQASAFIDARLRPVRQRADRADRNSRAAVQGTGAREGLPRDAAAGRACPTSRWTPKATRWACARAPAPGGSMVAVARAPRHRVSGRHRRQGQAAGHAARWRPASATTRAALALMLAVVRAMQAGEVSDDERHPVCRQRRRRRRGRPARRQVPAAAGQVQGPDQAVHRDRRRRSGQHHERRRRQPALPRDVQGAGRPQLRRVRPGEPGLRDGQRDREVLADPGARSSRRRRSTSASSAAEPRSTRFRPRSAWTSTCARSRARS